MIDITEPRQCPNCESYAVTESEGLDEFNVGRRLISVTVPYMHCSACGQRWTDYRAEDIRDAAVRDLALGPLK